ncbi:MAG TPA: DUF11 domain-containing protein, partial [Methanobacteriaceae archaeon]|nr:DUF11 domain-containing protein [Methanobacteriaceae archaeon]
STQVNATYNWWGNNTPTCVHQSETSYPKDIFEENNGQQNVLWDPYLYLRLGADFPIYNGATSTVTAYLTRDNNNVLAPGTVPDGTRVTFGLTNGPYGSLTLPLTRYTSAGQASIIFTANDPTAPHTQIVNAIVDHEQVSRDILINPTDSVSIIKTGNGPINAGETAIFTITVRNGLNAAHNIVITDALPAGFTVGVPTMGSVEGNVWTIQELAIGGVASLNITGVASQALSGTNITNTLTAVYDEEFTQEASAKIYVKKSSLYVNVNPTLINTTVGNVVTITYKVGNNGPDAANAVVMTFVIPEGLEFVNAISPDWTQATYDPATRTVTWNLGDVPVGDPILNIYLRVLRAGTFNLSPTIISATEPGQRIAVAATTINAQVQTHGQTVPMQNTGAPLAALLFAGIMVFAGMLLPKRK